MGMGQRRIERRVWIDGDPMVSVLGIDLRSPPPPYSGGLLRRAVHDGVNIVRIALEDRPDPFVRRLLEIDSVPDGPLLLVVSATDPTQGSFLESLATLEHGIRVPHLTFLEVMEGQLASARAIITSPGLSPPVQGVGILHRSLGGGAPSGELPEFVSVAHSLWHPGIDDSRVPHLAGRTGGFLALDPLPVELHVDRFGSAAGVPLPGGPLPLTQLRREAHAVLGFADLVKLRGRTLTEVALRYVLDTPGVSSTLLPLPPPELWESSLAILHRPPLAPEEWAWIRGQRGSVSVERDDP
jgi:hypothetical protein